MADTIGFMQNGITTNINDLTTYKITNITLGSPNDDLLWHTPDSGQNTLVRVEPGDRQSVLNMTVLGDDKDAIQNNISVLRQLMIDAARAEYNGDVADVDLSVQISGTTNTTVHRIKYGRIDDSFSHFRPEAQDRRIALDVQITLILEPFGELSSTITVRNDLANSPHFIQNETSATIADGWTKQGGGTTSMDTTNYLVGGQSQISTSAGGNQGARSDTVANTSDTSAVAYAWVWVQSGTVRVYLRDVDGAADLDTADIDSTDSGTVSDMTRTDTQGNTWYRVPVSASGFTSGNDVRLQVYSLSGAATFNIDACYLQLGTTTAPNAWMSSKHIENRNDPDSSNEDEICYIDICLLPGDAPALARYKIDVTNAAATSEGVLAFRGRDSSVLIADQLIWVEAEDNTSQTANSGSWAGVVDAARSGGNYERLTEGAGTTGGDLVFKYTGASARQFYHTPRRVYLIAKTDAATPANVNAQMEVRLGGNITLISGDVVSFQSTNDWQIVDLGSLNFAKVLPASVPDTANPQNINLYINLDGAANTELYEVDCIWLPFVDEGMSVNSDSNIITNTDFWLDGIQEAYINDGMSHRNTLGSIWQLEPGEICNRFMMQIYEISSPDFNEHKLGTTSDVTIEIQPRTRHLMGTQ